MAYDNYDLMKATDEHLVRPRFQAERDRRFYPSEASVQMRDEHGDLVVHGGCLRASYFRLSGEFEGSPYDARTHWIFKQGDSVETMLVEQWKEMGVWVDNSVKFVDTENNISGELDAILAEPPTGQLYGVEVKSFYGYQAETQLFGNRKIKAFPKWSQLLQTLVYLNHFEDRLPFFRMVYFARDSVKRRTFKIEFEHDGAVKYPKVEGEVVRSFSMDDVLARYRQLRTHVESNTVPPPDYELQYSATKIQDYHGKGKISDSKFNKWQSGKLKRHEHVGDWQCSYCRFKEVCWGGQQQLLV